MKNPAKRSDDLMSVNVEAESDWLTPAVQTKEQLKDWILVSLGAPLVTVELEDNQLNLCIQNALDKYTKYAWFGPDKYLMVNTKYYEPGRGFNLKGNRILSVKEISTQREGVMGVGMDIFFSPYSFFGQGGLGASPFFGQNNVSPSGSWVTYQNAVEWWKLAQRMTGSNPDFQYNKATQRLILMPEPRCGGDHILLLRCQVLPPIEELYGNEYVRRLCLAGAKMLLGTIRKKFGSVQLIGGGAVDTTIGDEGKEEWNQIMEELIKAESVGQCCVIA